MQEEIRKGGKWAKMTGERARIDAKVHKTAIVYNTKNGWVKEFYDGTLIQKKIEVLKFGKRNG
ncbi:hypothetical protein KQI49_11935 [Virgibacillus sp. MSJ-26]|uniref:hypothetical protein n=1 Tax=Virgibacillus sp. MSJ-26 TaxID=2841522 RepID=UPI001C115E50|nr:hypothetical protein [Virgibacillus sp. MSJ-26]MBU5467529.1 hypothetical protein [Virgibacillus sp. MSJ-26]